MSKVKETASKRSKRSDATRDLSLSDLGQVLIKQYGCGPIHFSGTDDALYERHLLFDDIVAPSAAGPREQFEAAARSARDVLSQRWVHDRKHLRPGKPEADLLPVDGISNWAVADQQYHQPSARSLRKANCRAEERRLARPDRRRARRRPRKRRARAPRGLLSRLDGDDAIAGDGLWAALRIRHLQTDHPRRLAA